MVGVFNDYLQRLIEKTEQFLRRMRWKAHFFLNPDTASPSKETYGFKSTKNPPPIEELKDFEDDMLRMIQSVKFKQVNSPFLNKLKEDTDHIKNEPCYLSPVRKTQLQEQSRDRADLQFLMLVRLGSILVKGLTRGRDAKFVQSLEMQEGNLKHTKLNFNVLNMNHLCEHPCFQELHTLSRLACFLDVFVRLW